MAVGVGTLVAVAGLAACGTAPGSSVHGLHGGTASKTSKATTTSASPTSTSTTKAPPPTASPSSTTGLRDGPGPQSTYVVEPQPAPGSCHYTFAGSDPLPDPHCTPGALNPQVTQGTIGSTICRSGYSSSIRPPESITEAEKRGSASAYSYTGPFSTGEYDHLVSLELGGDPNDPANLWVEPNDKPGATTTANSKDVLENRLHGLVCAGQLPLATAQDAIASNWVTAYQQYEGATPSPAPPAAAPSPAPAPPTTAAPAGCYPTTSGGNCYRAGELCPDADHGQSGVAGNGEAITCEDNDGWRWEPS